VTGAMTKLWLTLYTTRSCEHELIKVFFLQIMVQFKVAKVEKSFFSKIWSGAMVIASVFETKEIVGLDLVTLLLGKNKCNVP
jgi:hypothetical protein